MSWGLNPGDRVKRTELHRLYGGSSRGGITGSRTTPNVLIFSDLAVGRQHGYFDHWEGPVFHYCGKGQRGDQEMTGVNRSILEHVDQGRDLRVFEGAKGVVRYIGNFGLDPEKPWYWECAPESGGGPTRNVIMFRLIPIAEFFDHDTIKRREDLVPGLITPYRPVGPSPSLKPPKPARWDPDLSGRGHEAHRRLQDELASVAKSRGFDVLSPGPGDPAFDIGWREGDTVVIVEIKSLTRTNESRQLRLGLGQILDYEDACLRGGLQVRPTLAVEEQPRDPRWRDICQAHGVDLIWF